MTKQANLKYPMGTILSFECGEYSDFRVVGLLVTLADCDFKALAQQYCADPAWVREEWIATEFIGGVWVTRRRKGRKKQRPPQDFPSWLVANGYAAPVTHSEVYLGDGEWYPDFEIPDL